MSDEEVIDPHTWAVGRLDDFVRASSMVTVPSPPNAIGFHRYRTTAPNDKVVERWVVVERILERYLPDWRDRVREENPDYPKRGYYWQCQREAAQQCRTLLESQKELDTYLADNGPSLSAASLHPWVWDAAKLAWEAGNFEDAVDAAARNVNGRLRAKVGRKDIGEGDLIAQVFSDKPADVSNPRLRLPLPDGLNERTVANIHGGIIAFGKGFYQSVRNPLAHEAPGDVEMQESEALECLASLSLLARWIDRAQVHRS